MHWHLVPRIASSEAKDDISVSIERPKDARSKQT